MPRKRLEADAPLPLVVSAAGAPVDEAQTHFRRGVQLYADGDSAGALVELKTAYALVPNFRILFNLGQVAYQCGDHAAAFTYLTRYLTEGGGNIPDARRKEVARDLTELRARVGFLSIEAKDAALRVTVDDADVGVTPLAAPIPVDAGRRRIDVVARSGDRQTRTVDLAAGAILSVAFGPLGRQPLPSVAADIRTSAEQPRAPALIAAPLPPESPAQTPVIEPPRAPPAPVAIMPKPTPKILVSAPSQPAPDRGERRVPWVTWTLAAVAAGGAAATGALAWTTSQSLHDKAATYPVRVGDLQDLHDREHRYALASDGFLAGAVVLSAIALYLTLSRPSASDQETSSTVASRGW